MFNYFSGLARVVNVISSLLHNGCIKVLSCQKEYLRYAALYEQIKTVDLII